MSPFLYLGFVSAFILAVIDIRREGGKKTLSKVVLTLQGIYIFLAVTGNMMKIIISMR